jgi:hypothetical protein
MTPSQLAFEQSEFSSDKNYEQLKQSIDDCGYGVIYDAFSPSEIMEMRKYVEDEVAKRKGEYFSFVGCDAVRGTLLEQIGKSPAFQDLLSKLSYHVLGRHVQSVVPYQVLRVLSGETGLGQSMLFHYDAYAVTALVPIAIPKDTREPCGDLILYPNLRQIRSNVVFNVLEKTVFQNTLVRKFFSTRLAHRIFKAKVLRMDPGNIYFFRGYQTLHANEPCDPNSLRATALFHFGDPHENGPLLRLINNARRRHEHRKAGALLS